MFYFNLLKSPSSKSKVERREAKVNTKQLERRSTRYDREVLIYADTRRRK